MYIVFVGTEQKGSFATLEEAKALAAELAAAGNKNVAVQIPS